MYDPLVNYTTIYFRNLTPRELKILFEEAKKVSLEVYGIKRIKKVIKDIASMRILLAGFDSIHNQTYDSERKSDEKV